MQEEAYKIQRLLEESLYSGALPFKKYDLMSISNDWIAEFKPTRTPIEQVIFQAMLTAAREDQTFNFYLGDTPFDRKCIHGCDVDMRLLYAEKLVPSDNKSDRYKNLFSVFQPLISANLKDFPSQKLVDDIRNLKAKYGSVENQELLIPVWQRNSVPDLKKWLISDKDRKYTGAYYNRPRESSPPFKVGNESDQEK